MDTGQDQIDTLELVVGILNDLRIPYMIDGSHASSLHGERRFSEDVDIVLDVGLAEVEGLVRRLSPEFYVDLQTARDAVRNRDSFNAIHTGTFTKVDFFLVGTRAFDREAFRRRIEAGSGGPGSPRLVFNSPEDTVLRKLEWYRMGGEVSERPWRDVLGVLLVQAGRLDEAYLNRWAAQLGVADLLAKVRREAAGD